MLPFLRSQTQRQTHACSLGYKEDIIIQNACVLRIIVIGEPLHAALTYLHFNPLRFPKGKGSKPSAR